MIEYKETPSSALAIFAHPDDADISCGGTLAKWAQGGARLGVAVCARGEKGTYDPSLDPEELSRRREGEVRAALGVLGVTELFWLGEDDGEITNSSEFRHRLVALVREFRPEVVLAPDPTAVFFANQYFNHRDHRELGFAVLDAIFPAARLPHYFPEGGKPHSVAHALLSGSLNPNVLVDVAAEMDKKVGAVACHESQFQLALADLRKVLLSGAAEAGQALGMRYAEAFQMVASPR